MGFCNVELVPSPKSQTHEIAPELSEKFAVNGAHAVTGDAGEKLLTGAVTLMALEETRVSLHPTASVTINVTI